MAWPATKEERAKTKVAAVVDFMMNILSKLGKPLWRFDPSYSIEGRFVVSSRRWDEL